MGAVPQASDFLQTQINLMVAMGQLAQDVVGLGTFASGFACTPSGGLSIGVGPGSLYSIQPIDTVAFGSLGTNATPITKQGISTSTTVTTLNAPTTAGYAVNYLVEAAYTEVDDNATVLGYYNSANPNSPLPGSGGSGVPQPTLRQGTVTLTFKSGTAAPSGTQLTPAADSNNIGLYVVTLTTGQTTVVTGNIKTVAGSFIPSTLANAISLTVGDGRYQQLTARTAAEISASVTPSSLQYSPWRGEDVRRFGAVGDNATDNSGFITSANSVGASLYFPPGTYVVNANITLMVPCIFDYGAILKPAAGRTITINGPVHAGPWQIFNVSSSGSLITSSGMNSSGISTPIALRPMTYGARVPVEWFGAVGDNVTDDTVAIQNACNLARDSNICGIQLQAKLYHVTTSIVVDARGGYWVPSMYGVNGRKTQLCLRGAALQVPALRYISGAGAQCHAVVESIGFNGDANSNGISLEGTTGLRMIECVFDTSFGGIVFNNSAAGSFTEYCVAEYCEFTESCAAPVQYVKSSVGTLSFHGSGLRHCRVDTVGSEPVVTIDAGCFTYNAPLDLQVWTVGSTPAVLVNNLSSYSATFHGDITIEIDGAGLTLAEGNGVFSTGRILTENNNVFGGTFTQCESVQINSDTSINPLGVRKAHAQLGVTGDNTLVGAASGQTVLIDVRIYGNAGYDYRGAFLVINQGLGGAGYVATLLSQVVTNSALYGAPTVSVNSSGQLVLTNALFAATGMSITWAEKSFSAGIAGGTAQAQF